MKCNQSIQHIILETSERGFKQHVDSCESCNDLNSKVNATVSLLDLPVEVPEGLIRKVDIRKDIIIGRRKRLDVAGILQFSTVIAAGILLGIVLGRNANIRTLISKHSKKTESLIEYREKHHLNTDYKTLF